MPEEANCLGKENGWYKVGLENGKTGYIRQDLVDWSEVDYRPYVEKEYYKTFVSGDGVDFKGSIGSETFEIILKESENALDEDGRMWEYFGTVTYPGSAKNIISEDTTDKAITFWMPMITREIIRENSSYAEHQTHSLMPSPEKIIR